MEIYFYIPQPLPKFHKGAIFGASPKTFSPCFVSASELFLKQNNIIYQPNNLAKNLNNNASLYLYVSGWKLTGAMQRCKEQ